MQRKLGRGSRKQWLQGRLASCICARPMVKESDHQVGSAKNPDGLHPLLITLGAPLRVG